MKSPYFSALILLGLVASPLSAQVYAPTSQPHAGSPVQGVVDTRGFHLGIGLNGSAIRAEDLSTNTESGGGIHLKLGYGVSPNVSLFAAGIAASMEGGDYSLGQFDLGVRGYFPGSSRWVPSVEGAVTGRAMVIDIGMNDDLELTGVGFTFGGGVDYYVAPSASLGVNLGWTVGKFTDAKMGSESGSLGNDSFSALSTRFNVGLTWWP